MLFSKMARPQPSGHSLPSHSSVTATSPTQAQSQSVPVSECRSTPRSGKGHVGIVGQNMLRPNVADEMIHELQICPLDEFLKVYAPCRPTSASVDAALRRMETMMPANGNWLGFGKGETEKTVFAKLTPIITALGSVDCVCEKEAQPRTLNFHYVDSSDIKICGEIKGSSYRVDACLLPTLHDTPPKELTVSELALVAEYKKSSTTDKVYDDRLKVLSAANHIMNDDPRRMWTYGVTIEHEKMALWYFSRSYSVKSEEFEYKKDRKTFLKIFMSFLFATEAEMGFDPTVRRVLHGKEIRYIYTITPENQPPRFFRMIRPIYIPRVACITGRQTRVWEAEEVNESSDSAEVLRNDGKRVVLKDVWLDERSQPESEIMDLIMKKLEVIASQPRDWPAGHLGRCITAALEDFPANLPFMKIDCTSTGTTCRAQSETSKPDPSILKPLPLVPTLQQSDRLVLPGSSQRHSRIPTTSSGHSSPGPSPRLGFSYQAPNSSLALTLLFLAGWVHRDVSTGNIIVVKSGDSFRGLLSDFEYAKEVNRADEPKHDPKTGTPFFMALEVHLGVSIVDKSSGMDGPEEQARLRAAIRNYKPGFKADGVFGPVVSPPWRFQHHHNLESLMWIALWFLLCRVKPILSAISNELNEEPLADQIFTNTPEPSPIRLKLFITPGYRPMAEAFHPNLGHDFNQKFTSLHRLLYQTCARQSPLSREDFTELHDFVWFYFGNIIDAVVQATGIDIEEEESDADANAQPPNAGETEITESANATNGTSKSEPRKRKASHTPHPFRLRSHHKAGGST
ncbi:hypothetical protein NP233_g6201 [Leucocoprinus birnbaumii]|uniref:Fungal-type protein kinase domain-containing protein n=1 Tax=Leucocoprinus birnbaumii TaxID=56174 RepID=A0AAD5YR56_9AGAR|nr:hypothetical protein NP233_g6201 [Leucocoprinus birnbaumii]